MKNLIKWIVENADKFQYDENGRIANLESKFIDSDKFEFCNGITFTSDREYRIKPEPEYVPFDKDDMLITMPIVSKYNPYQRLSIQSQDGISVLISAAGVISKARWITYTELFDEFLQIDKKPCGKLGVKTYKMRGIPPFMTERNGEGSNE